MIQKAVLPKSAVGSCDKIVALDIFGLILVTRLFMTNNPISSNAGRSLTAPPVYHGVYLCTLPFDGTKWPNELSRKSHSHARFKTAAYISTRTALGEW